MSGKVRFDLNRAGVRELMRSSEAQTACEEYGNRIAAAAGPGYEVTTQTGVNRVHVRVAPATKEAINDNFRHNTLIKAMRGAQE